MTEITAALRKKISSLSKDARTRREEGLFVAEGSKCVLDTLPFFNCEYLFATNAWHEAHRHKLPAGCNFIQAKRADIERMSHMKTPPEVLAVYHIPEHHLSYDIFSQNITLALDGIQDPGNLGTIIRVADWMGITDILCSNDTVDVYNPKVIQATMGAISRVKTHYVDLAEKIASLPQDIVVYGTFLDGDNIYQAKLSDKGIIVMGNEGKGISLQVAEIINRRLLIPSFPSERPTSESLNVAVATAITLAEFRRRSY